MYVGNVYVFQTCVHVCVGKFSDLMRVCARARMCVLAL